MSITDTCFPECQLQLGNCLLLNAGYIAPGDPQPVCHLLLGMGTLSAQPIPQAEQFPFPLVQALGNHLPQLFRPDGQVDLIEDIVLIRHDVHDGQGIAVLVGINGIVEVDILGCLFRARKYIRISFSMHRDA